jgi:hypothetical protein
VWVVGSHHRLGLRALGPGLGQSALAAGSPFGKGVVARVEVDMLKGLSRLRCTEERAYRLGQCFAQPAQRRGRERLCHDLANDARVLHGKAGPHTLSARDAGMELREVEVLVPPR